MASKGPVETFLTLAAGFVGLLIAVYVRLKVRARQKTRPKPKRDLADLVGQQLKWAETGFRAGDYELLLNDEVVATLSFRNWSLRQSARGESANGCWMFKGLGLANRRLGISACGTESVLAVFEYTTGRCGGRVTVAGGRHFNFGQTVASTYEVQEESGVPLIRFITYRGWTRQGMSLEIMPDAGGMAELSWMAMLGCYLIGMTGGEPIWRQMVQPGAVQ